MTSRLKPLLLPQLVEDRKHSMSLKHQLSFEGELPFVYHTTNSSSSDITTPITPTFSARGHFRGSSSTSSLDLSAIQLQPQECPASPIHQVTKQTSMRQLPDVQEEPLERDEDRTVMVDHFDLYSCLCDEPCSHGKSSEKSFSAEMIGDHDFDYDLGCLSDSEWHGIKKQESIESPFARLGSRFSTLNRWKSSRKLSLMSSPTTEVSFDHALSRGTSTRSSSISSPLHLAHQIPDHFYDSSTMVSPTLSIYPSADDRIDFFEEEDEDAVTPDLKTSLERERAHSTTPLLPPLFTKPCEPPLESPLQSPTIAPSSNHRIVHQSSRSCLSTKASITSLRMVPRNMDLFMPLPAHLQEYDEWSDRLGHANFTITPHPYELSIVDADSIAKFRSDWETAKVNYTKHLVRVGENYGQTSKTYGLTEAKWAGIEKRWQQFYEGAIKDNAPIRSTARKSTISSRSRSRGRGRMRSGSATATIMGRPANDDFYAEMQWERLQDGMPSVVPRMLEADGKFPSLGDEDIVGPMHRAETMARSHSEEKYSTKFWKNLVDKVGLKR